MNKWLIALVLLGGCSQPPPLPQKMRCIHVDYHLDTYSVAILQDEFGERVWAKFTLTESLSMPGDYWMVQGNWLAYRVEEEVVRNK